MICNVENHCNPGRTTVVCTGDRLELQLTRGVPDLQLVRLAVLDTYATMLEIHTNGHRMLIVKLVLCVTSEQTCLPTLRTSNKEYFECAPRACFTNFALHWNGTLLETCIPCMLERPNGFFHLLSPLALFLFLCLGLRCLCQCLLLSLLKRCAPLLIKQRVQGSHMHSHGIQPDVTESGRIARKGHKVGGQLVLDEKFQEITSQLRLLGQGAFLEVQQFLQLRFHLNYADPENSTCQLHLSEGLCKALLLQG
mmetsp:Transcript_59812/g.118534  ORF Transcript_59812/g.118534 Transcript_59812/m.118534 type:complete len:252 (+) Transcript_59812:1347-2102(+)